MGGNKESREATNLIRFVKDSPKHMDTSNALGLDTSAEMHTPMPKAAKLHSIEYKTSQLVSSNGLFRDA